MLVDMMQRVGPPGFISAQVASSIKIVEVKAGSPPSLPSPWSVNA